MPTQNSTCSVDGCDRQTEKRDWCGMHYQRWRNNGDPLVVRETRRPKRFRLCSIDGCGKPHCGKGFCQAHYDRWRDYGDPFAGKEYKSVPRGAAEDRFWPKVNKTDTCWLWIGATGNHGYGNFGSPSGTKSRSISAHRFAYESLVGPVPQRLELDHLCRVRLCVNPSHLEPVTRQINLLRGNTFAAANAAKTSCPKGHPYSGINKSGRRFCGICREGRDKGRRRW